MPAADVMTSPRLRRRPRLWSFGAATLTTVLVVSGLAACSDDPDPLTAKPASMVIGTKGGTWSAEGSAPMTEVLPLLDDPDTRHGAHTALDQYLTEKED